MIEVLISCARPESLDEPELRSWLADQIQALSGRSSRVPAAERPARHDRDGLVRFALDSDSVRSVEDRIAELVTDMRMLGLRPEAAAVYRGPPRSSDTSRDGPSR